jgi:peptidoglycan/xylan/chitin deacetylase (PgdA/CDA1 family)
VVSLDFELHWGVRDRHGLGSPYLENVVGGRTAIPRLLGLFRRFEIHATWAAVGMLACRDRREWEALRPDRLPRYRDPRLSPYGEAVGEDEDADPLHFAPSLLREISGSPGQEIGSHTFSHYYCLEPDQSAEEFLADLRTALMVHRSLGLPAPRSIVFPRNQINGDYLSLLLDQGFRAFRGNQRAWMYRRGDGPSVRRRHRAGRLLDAYLPVSGHHLTSWEDVLLPNGLCNVPASLFLRPCPDPGGAMARLQRGRIHAAMAQAAEDGRIFHLWWHPHNFGRQQDANLLFLEGLLEEFAQLRRRRGMVSASMSEVAAAVTNS